MKPKITERGWAGHFICAHRCLFRRNTLIDFGKRKIVVRTVGMYRNMRDEYDTIGAGGMYYETMAFQAKKDGPYWDADVSKQLFFSSEWAICADSFKKLPKNADNLADDMHDAVVEELSTRRKRNDPL